MSGSPDRAPAAHSGSACPFRRTDSRSETAPGSPHSAHSSSGACLLLPELVIDRGRPGAAPRFGHTPSATPAAVVPISDRFSHHYEEVVYPVVEIAHSQLPCQPQPDAGRENGEELFYGCGSPLRSGRTHSRHGCQGRGISLAGIRANSWTRIRPAGRRLRVTCGEGYAQGGRLHACPRGPD